MQPMGPEFAGALGVIIYVIVVLAVILPIPILVCSLLYGPLKRVPPQFRQIEPGLIWLLLIPCVGIVWNFIALPKVSRSYKSYFNSIGRTDMDTCGEGIALGYSVCIACCLIPCLLTNGMAFLAALVLLIAYLAKILALKAQIPVSDYPAEQGNTYRREE